MTKLDEQDQPIELLQIICTLTERSAFTQPLLSDTIIALENDFRATQIDTSLVEAFSIVTMKIPSQELQNISTSPLFATVELDQEVTPHENQPPCE